MMRMRVLSVLALSGWLLAACSGSKEDDIRQWMVEERNRTQPKVAPIPAPKQFKPEPYSNATALEPVSNQKLTQALKRDSSQAAANVALIARIGASEEPLEAFPLDTMVGGQHHRPGSM
jgi:type IV pilus assembly protein PilP